MIHSLRGRLLLSTLGIFAVAWVIVGYMVEQAEHRQVAEQFDVLLQQQFHFLQAIVRHETAEGDVAGFSEALAADDMLVNHHGHSYGLEFQILSPTGVVVMSSPGARELEFMGVTDGFNDKVIGNYRWRVLAQSDSISRHRIAVGYRLDDREELMEDIVEETLRPLSVVMLGLALLLWYVVGRGLVPLKKLAADVMRRHPLALQAVEMNKVPQEVQPMVAALNNLFHRLEEAFDSYDHFTADAAHELRTPLAGLTLQVEASLRATSDAERQHALFMVRRGLDRATRIVEQMLALARLSTLDDRVTAQATDLYDPCLTVTETLASVAAAREVEIHLAGEVDTKAMGADGLIEIMVDNLVRNALLHSPRGATVTVEIGVADGQPYIMVDDEGPGIPPEARRVVQQRFQRLPTDDGEGSGLGLAIVRRIVSLHGAELELTERPAGRGLRAAVRFPRCDQP